jgi:hypothetical protein
VNKVERHFEINLGKRWEGIDKSAVSLATQTNDMATIVA